MVGSIAIVFQGTVSHRLNRGRRLYIFISGGPEKKWPTRSHFCCVRTNSNSGRKYLPLRGTRTQAAGEVNGTFLIFTATMYTYFPTRIISKEQQSRTSIDSTSLVVPPFGVAKLQTKSSPFPCRHHININRKNRRQTTAATSAQPFPAGSPSEFRKGILRQKFQCHRKFFFHAN